MNADQSSPQPGPPSPPGAPTLCASTHTGAEVGHQSAVGPVSLKKSTVSTKLPLESSSLITPPPSPARPKSTFTKAPVCHQRPAPLTKFTVFQNLPDDIRVKIWDMASSFEPRNIFIKHVAAESRIILVNVFQAAMLSATFESRQAAMRHYKMFELGSRITYVNWSIDTFFLVGDDVTRALTHFASDPFITNSCQRLFIKNPVSKSLKGNTCVFPVYTINKTRANTELSRFKNLKEVNLFWGEVTHVPVGMVGWHPLPRDFNFYHEDMWASQLVLRNFVCWMTSETLHLPSFKCSKDDTIKPIASVVLCVKGSFPHWLLKTENEVLVERRLIQARAAGLPL